MPDRSVGAAAASSGATDERGERLPAAPPGTPPATYVPTPGVHPMHDDPFLACTRARESGGPALLEIDGGRILVPFVKAICTDIRPQDRVILADLPEGLEDLGITKAQPAQPKETAED